MILCLLVWAPPVGAHPLAPALVELVEDDGGQVHVTLRSSLYATPGVRVEIFLPDHCAPRGSRERVRDERAVSESWTVDCGARGLVGQVIAARGLAASAIDAVLRVSLADGRTHQAVLRGEDATWTVPARALPLRVAFDYARLGFFHIASGFDHLLFVFGLVLLVRGGRMLLLTISAFTLGHSLTLALAVLGYVRASPELIEVGIAASIALLAAELWREPDPQHWLRRSPASAACAFGLLHGLGFAGALTRIGLPQEEVPLALLSFNVGIELGQLVFVAAVVGVAVFVRRSVPEPSARLARVPIFVMGTLAAYWTFQAAAASAPFCGGR